MEREFENIINNELSTHKITPRQGVWSGIEAELDRRKNKRIGAFYWISASVALLLIFAVSAFYLEHSKSDNNLAENKTQSIDTKANESLIATENIPSAETSKTSLELNNTNEQQSTINQNLLATNKKSDKANPMAASTNNQSVQKRFAAQVPQRPKRLISKPSKPIAQPLIADELPVDEVSVAAETKTPSIYIDSTETVNQTATVNTIIDSVAVAETNSSTPNLLPNSTVAQIIKVVNMFGMLVCMLALDLAIM
jgi:hypothetical protein